MGMGANSFGIVGAGICGLAHAYALAKRGHSVTVYERDDYSRCATVRNFGMVWPIGQRLGPERARALRSRELWLELANSAGLWHKKCGSLHLAYHEDEARVIQEFLSMPEVLGEGLEWIDAERVLNISPHVRSKDLLGALWSPYEICVDPRTAARDIADHLAAQFGVRFRWSRTVTEVAEGVLRTAEETFEHDHVIVCSGAEFETLFPAAFRGTGTVRCRLQMMRAEPKDPSMVIGAHLCAGLTLLHYKGFEACASLAKLKERLSRQWPACLEHGVHALVSQHGDRTLTLGDSHQYGMQFPPYQSEAVDQQIMNYLNTFLPTDSLQVIEKWEGVYAIHPSESYVRLNPAPGVTFVNALGGAGMTLSFAIGEESASILSSSND